MAPKGGKSTPIDPGLIGRISGALRYALTGATPDAWMGPGSPSESVAPEETKGRARDYPVGFNIASRPRSEYGESRISHATLRRVADPTCGGLDLLRLAIETRKDQLACLKWSIRERGAPAGKEQSARAKEIESHLRKPDGVYPYRTWLRGLIEDLLVIDAPTIYVRQGRTRPIAETIAGDTIKVLLGVDGRRPEPPEAAFQQFLKGVPGAKYSTDELVYHPRNVLPNRVYGMSPVEQIVGIVDLALQRQLSQSSYFTPGSVPDMMLAAPENWSPAQIEQFQAWWDTIMDGPDAITLKRKARWIPHGTVVHATKEAVLKNEWDEWLARVICYALSISPQALIKELNRAQADINVQAANQEGLEPLKLWISDTMGLVINLGWRDDEHEWVWGDEEISDPVKKSTVAKTLVDARIAKAAYLAEHWYGLPADAVPEELPTGTPAPAGSAAGGAGAGSPQPSAKAAEIADLAVALSDRLEKKKDQPYQSTVTPPHIERL